MPTAENKESRPRERAVFDTRDFTALNRREFQRLQYETRRAVKQADAEDSSAAVEAIEDKILDMIAKYVVSVPSSWLVNSEDQVQDTEVWTANSILSKFRSNAINWLIEDFGASFGDIEGN